jgi:hypothetical protein
MHYTPTQPMQRRNKSTCRNIKGGHGNDYTKEILLGGRNKSTCRKNNAGRGGNTNDSWRHVMNRLGGRNKSTCRNIKGVRGDYLTRML